LIITLICKHYYLDGIIDDNSIVEIKAPYAAKDTLNINEAVESGKVSIFNIKNNFTFVYLPN